MVDRSVDVALRIKVADFKRDAAEAKSATKAMGAEFGRASHDADKLEAGLKGAGKGTDDLGKGVKKTVPEIRSLRTNLLALDAQGKKTRQGLNELGSTGGKVAVGAGLALAAVVGVSANFGQSMSNIAATGDEARAAMSDLSDAAIQAGADTAFSAGEAAGGIENLLKAGVSVSDVLGGGLTGSLDLAAAGQLEVADAAEIAASALTQFKLGGEDVEHVADLLAAGAGKAQGSVTDLAAALNQSGLVAAQTGLSIEETTGTLAAFASAGLMGSDAGTSFKTFLQSLTPSSVAAATAMDEMGFSAYDAEGKFKGIVEVAAELRTGLADMSEEQQAATLKTIFGSDAVRAASVIYQQGGDGIQGWIDKTNDAGYAADTASTRMDNLKGDVEALGGSLETFLIGAGEGSQSPLRTLAQDATGLVNALNEVPGPIKNVAVELLAIVAVTGGGLWFGSKVVGGITSTRTALADLDLQAKLTKTSLGGVAAGAARVALPVAGLMLMNSDLGDSFGATNTVSLAAAGAIAGPWGAAVGGTIGVAKDAAGANNDLAAAIDSVNTAIASGQIAQAGGELQAVSAQLDEFRSNMEAPADFGLDNPFSGQFWSNIANGPAALKNQVEGIFGDSDVEEAADAARQAQAAYDALTGSVAGLAGGLGMAIGPLDGSEASLRELAAVLAAAQPAMDDLRITTEDLSNAQAVANGTASWMQTGLAALNPTYDQMVASIAAGTAATDDYAGATDDSAAANQAEADAITSAMDAMRKKTSAALSAFDAETQYKQALKDAQAQAATNEAGLKGSSDEALANASALSSLAGAWNGQSNAVKNNVGRYQAAKKAFVDTAVAMGVNEDHARSLAKRYLEIPRKVQTKIEADAAAALAKIQAVKAARDALKDKTIYLTTVARTVRKMGGQAPGSAYASGGYTGDGGKYEPAGIVHRGEVVLPQEVVKRDWGMLSTRYGNLPGMAGGGLAGGYDGSYRDKSAGLGWLGKTARDAGDGLKGLKHRLEESQKALEAEKRTRDDARSYRSTVAGSVSSDLFGNGLAGFDLAVEANTNDNNSLAKALLQARKKGLDGPLFDVLAASGDLATIQQFAGLSRAGITSRENSYRASMTAGGRAGDIAVQAKFGQSIDQMDGTIRDLNRTVNRLEHQVAQMGKHVKDGARDGTREGNSDRNRSTSNRTRTG